jgi:diadenosine tetraphosphate (Ap4A) HIT family hydrolase
MKTHIHLCPPAEWEKYGKGKRTKKKRERKRKKRKGTVKEKIEVKRVI